MVEQDNVGRLFKENPFTSNKNNLLQQTAWTHQHFLPSLFTNIYFF